MTNFSPLEEMCELIIDCPHFTPEWTSSGHLVIRNENIRDGQLNLSNKSYTNEEDYKKRIRRAKPISGDIIFTREAPMGEVCIVPEGLECCTGQRQVLLRPKKSVCGMYLFYALRSPYVRHQIFWNEGTGSTVSNVRIPILKILKIPRNKNEKSISIILKALDDKIELNRRINATLDAMCRALFKSWFVDFDPIKAKMEGRQPHGMDAATAALFPSSFVPNNLVKIPQGWQEISFGDLLIDAIGGDWGEEKPTNEYTQAVNIIRGTDMPALFTGGRGSVPMRYTSLKKLKNRELAEGDIVVEVSGGSPTQPTGRSIFITQSILSRFNKPMVCASFCRRFRPKSIAHGMLAYLHLASLYDAGGTWEYQNQSTGISNFQTTNFLEKEKVILPSQQILSAFSNKIKALFQMSTNNESLYLEEMRDYLLPKLISGEIQIPDAEKLVGAA